VPAAFLEAFMGESDRRDEFLKQMYSEMWNNINRHLTVTWQAVGVLAGGFAVFFGLAERQAISIDMAAALMLLIAAWQLCHVYDANTWFNRNLGIISNIERQFLTKRDEKEIEFYFTEPHRKPGNLVGHLRVQRAFGLGVIALVLGIHFASRVLPGIHSPFSNFEPLRAAPYVTAAICAWWVMTERAQQIGRQKEFVKRSPGAPVSEDRRG
jgi:hypothetical protein